MNDTNVQHIVQTIVSNETQRHIDLVCAQHIRAVLAHYRKDLDNHQIYLILTEEARKYAYEDYASMKAPGEDVLWATKEEE